LQLNADNFAVCGTILERFAYRLLAMELDAALSQLTGDRRFNHDEDLIKNASIVVRLIRNAVAHNILDPVWKNDRKLQNRKVTIDEYSRSILRD
jgi:hypothetical protein